MSNYYVEFWDVFFGDFEKNGKQRYIDYYDEVRSLVPEGKLLETEWAKAGNHSATSLRFQSQKARSSREQTTQMDSSTDAVHATELR